MRKRGQCHRASHRYRSSSRSRLVRQEDVHDEEALPRLQHPAQQNDQQQEVQEAGDVDVDAQNGRSATGRQRIRRDVSPSPRLAGSPGMQQCIQHNSRRLHVHQYVLPPSRAAASAGSSVARTQSPSCSGDSSMRLLPSTVVGRPTFSARRLAASTCCA